MSNTDQFEIPNNWAIAKIGDLILPEGVFVDGDWVESKDQDPRGDVRLIQLADVGDGYYLDRSSRFLTSAKAAQLQCTFLNEGDILIARMPEPLGRACMFPGDIKRAVTVVDVCIVRTGLGIDNHRWLMWAINSPAFRNEIAALQSGVTRGRISRRNLASLSLPVPPLNEQRRIAAEIDKQSARLDEGVTALKRVAEDLKLYRASVLKAACEGRLVLTEAELARTEGRTYEPANDLLLQIIAEHRARWEANQLAKLNKSGKRPKSVEWRMTYVEPEFPQTSELDDLPEGWVWARTEQICDFITKGTTPSAEKLSPYPGDVPFIKVYNLTDRGVLDFTIKPTFVSQEVHEGELARSKVFPGDVLMNIVGPPLGKVSIVPDEYEEWNINQAIAVFRPMPSLDRNYLCLVLLTKHILWWAIRRAKTTAGQSNLTLEICRDLPVPIPPLAEQQRIVAEVKRRLQVVDELTEFVAVNLKRAEELRHSILKRAFAGGLVPQDPYDEPASTLLERIAADRNRRAEEAMSRKKQGKTSRRGSGGDIQSKGATLFEKETQPSLQDVADLIHRRPLSYMHMTDERSTVEDLFRRSHHDFASAEDIDRFFADLTKELVNQTIVLIREGDEIFLERGHA